MPHELTITSADGRSRSVELEGARFSLGRSTANELCYPEDVGLSRQHLVFECEGDVWTVRDLGSKNGTFVNGVRLTGPQNLSPGDRIVASRTLLVYDPGATAKTVLFEHRETPGGAGEHTVSTTLDELLPAPEAQRTPIQWNSAVMSLVRAGRELAMRRPLPELFRVILDLALEAVGAKRGVLLTLEKGELVVQALRGEGFRISTAVRDRVIEGKKSVLVRDTRHDEALRERYSIVVQAVRTLMAVPLQTDDRVIGLIYLDTPSLVRQFTTDDLNLLTVMANVAAIRIERERLAEVEHLERIMAAELEQAADIQRRFLPARAPVLPGLDLAGYNAACRTVGGDYYDFLPYPDGRVALVIGDVAGKGMPAALMMTSLQAKVQAIADAPAAPSQVVTRLNRSMSGTCPDNRFVTFFFCLLDPRNGELAYCNAGHNPPLLVRRNGTVTGLDGGGPVLGILSTFTYEDRRCRLGPGDVVLLYSDGVTEACDPQGEEFGEERLSQLARGHRNESAEAIVASVRDAIQSWGAGQPAADDITLVAARLSES